MKTILLTFALLLSVSAYSQSVINQPKLGMSTAPNLKLEKIELLDTATVLWFNVKTTPGDWISVPKETYIQPVGEKGKLYLVSADGIPMGKKYTMPASGEVNYKLIFPKIATSVAKLDFGEGNQGGTWFIYDIQLKPERFKSILPEKLSRNWFREDNAQWEISLLDSLAVYKSQVWKCLQYSEKNGMGIARLSNEKKSLSIYTKFINDSICLIGETAAKLVKYTREPVESAIPVDDEPFKLPVFKIDTATYSGFIKGYNPRFGVKTGIVYVNDVLAGGQNSFTIRISENGYYSVKIPMTNMQTVFVNFSFYSGQVFLEPGKSLFQMIDLAENKWKYLFMGNGARINSDLVKLKNIERYDINFSKIRANILDLSPEQYKNRCFDVQRKEFEAFDEFRKSSLLSNKAYQIKKLSIEYLCARNVMGYASNFQYTYRQKNKIPQDQRELPIEIPKVDSTYYSFITNDFVNNPLGVLVSDYYFFHNSLMFLEILRSNFKALSISEIIEKMEKSGYKLSLEDKQLMIRAKEGNTSEFSTNKNENQKRYEKQRSEFLKKYAEKIVPLYKEKKGAFITASDMEEYLIGKKVEFTDEEKAYFVEAKAFESNPSYQEFIQFGAETARLLTQFFMDHQTFISGLYQERTSASRNELLQKVLGIKPGLASDLMTSQEFCRKVVSELTPVTNEKLKAFQQKIANPFIANYLEIKNNETKAKIDGNKQQTGSKVNEVPKTEGDKVFDAIMAKYKGKVVYVDFWATWCAPCRSGIERIRPLKDEMANENVVFVYITNQTSLKTTYDNMIPTIKGEHYRVSTDEWNLISDRFKISGIPHYALVGKDGKVINPQLGFLDNTKIKSLLMKYANE